MELEVELLIDDQATQEYTDEDFEQEPVEHEASKYIEALEGASFAFRCTVHPRYVFEPGVDYLAYEMTVDGESVMGLAANKKLLHPDEGMTSVRKGYVSRHAGQLQEEEFRFTRFEVRGMLSLKCTVNARPADPVHRRKNLWSRTRSSTGGA